MENNTLHILIVDDDERIRDLLKDYLSNNNYTTTGQKKMDSNKWASSAKPFDNKTNAMNYQGYNITRETTNNFISGFDVSNTVKTIIDIYKFFNSCG